MNQVSNAATRTPVLVFGDDGSSAADVACLWVANHRWDGWDAEIITALMPTFAAPESPPEFRTWASPHDRSILSGAGFTEVRHLTIERDPRLVFDAKPDADLIVIGDSNEKSIVPHLGSTAEWLIHHPPAPLALIRSARAVRSVLVCADGSGHSHAALEALLALPLSRNVDVTVLHVDEGRGRRSAIDEAMAMLSAAGITPRLRSDTGRPATCIANELRREPRDLTVLGTRGVTGLNRLLLGSTANAVIRSGNGSVLIATHRPDTSSPST